MKFQSPSGQGDDLWIGAVVSVAIHAVVMAAMVMGFHSESKEESHQPEESMEVVLDETPAAPDREAEPEDAESTQEGLDAPMDARAQPPALSPENEEEEQEEDEEVEEEQEEIDEEPEPIDDQMLERYAVDQQSDDEEPEDAEHIAEEAHRTDEETVAEVTTLEDVARPDDPEALEQEADTDRELAMQAPDEAPAEPDIAEIDEMQDDDLEDDEEVELDEDEALQEDPEVEAVEPQSPEEIAEHSPEPESQYRDPQEMFRAPDRPGEQASGETEPDREAVFGGEATANRQFLEEQQARQGESGASRPPQGRRLLSNWRENEEAMRAALENYLPHVQPGNHTSVNARAAPHAAYIARMHRSIHPKWAESFIPRVSRNFSSRDPINDMSREVVIEIVIDADTGEVEQTGPARPSGHSMYDAEAMNVARNIGPQPDPPEAIVSRDGKVYIHWTFWRDQRRCGTFGARIVRLTVDDRRRPPGQ